MVWMHWLIVVCVLCWDQGAVTQQSRKVEEWEWVELSVDHWKAIIPGGALVPPLSPYPGDFCAGTSGGQRARVSQITGCWLGKTLCPLGPASVLWPDGFGSSLSLSEAYNPHQMFHITQCEKPPILSDFLQVHTSVETRYSIFHSASWMSLWGMRVHMQQASSGFDQLDRN